MRTIILSLFMVLTTSLPAWAQLNHFLGSWKNTKPDTRGITKIQIRNTRAGLRVKTWGQCHPSDCFWGEVEAFPYAPNVSANMRHTAVGVTAVYQNSFSVKILVIRAYARRKLLKVEAFTRFTDNSGRSNYTTTAFFQRRKRPDQVVARCADLVVRKIYKPKWDQKRRRSIIRAVITNIGQVTTRPTVARLVDPSTPQRNGARYHATAKVPSLAPGRSFTVTFKLPYWVFNPDATLLVTADYKRMVKECNEKNNTKKFKALG